MKTQFFLAMVFSLALCSIQLCNGQDISAQDIRNCLNQFDPNSMDIEVFLFELSSQNPDLAEVIKENKVTSDKITPLMIAMMYNPNLVPHLFEIESKGMEQVKLAQKKFLANVTSRRASTYFRDFRANDPFGDLLKNIQYFLGYQKQADFEKDFNLLEILTTLLAGPVDASGKTCLDYAQECKDQQWLTIFKNFENLFHRE